MDMESGTSSSVDTNSSPVSSAPAPESNYSQAPAEKLFKQSEINDIMKREKYGAVEDYKRSMARNNQGESNRQESPRQTESFTQDDVRRMAVEESQRLRDEWIADAKRQGQEQEAQKIVGEFFNKLSTGKDKYQDYDAVTGDVDYGRFPNTVQLLNSYVDNTSDVMYELGKDRSKLALLEQLAHMSPRDAIVQVQRLSQSIKDNDGVGRIRVPNEPLSQLKPSPSGTDNGGLSVKDLRSKYRA